MALIGGGVGLSSGWWCEWCLHPIDSDAASFVETYKKIGEFDRKVYFHADCFDPRHPDYFDTVQHRPNLVDLPTARRMRRIRWRERRPGRPRIAAASGSPRERRR